MKLLENPWTLVFKTCTNLDISFCAVSLFWIVDLTQFGMFWFDPSRAHGSVLTLAFLTRSLSFARVQMPARMQLATWLSIVCSLPWLYSSLPSPWWWSVSNRPKIREEAYRMGEQGPGICPRSISLKSCFGTLKSGHLIMKEDYLVRQCPLFGGTQNSPDIFFC